MIKKLFTLFKLARKLAKSDTLKIISKFNKPPALIIFFFRILSFSFKIEKETNFNLNEEKKLSN